MLFILLSFQRAKVLIVSLFFNTLLLVFDDKAADDYQPGPIVKRPRKLTSLHASPQVSKYDSRALTGKPSRGRLGQGGLGGTDTNSYFQKFIKNDMRKTPGSPYRFIDYKTIQHNSNSARR